MSVTVVGQQHVVAQVIDLLLLWRIERRCLTLQPPLRGFLAIKKPREVRGFFGCCWKGLISLRAWRVQLRLP